MTGARVLVVGGGGREHALAWKLASSPQVESVLVAPGNAGTTSWSDCKVTNVALDISDLEALGSWCCEQSINLVVVGPEEPLAKGMVDHLSSQGICCFGPKSEAAELESSKQFAKEFMTRHGIPTARFQSFQDAEAARSHINSVDYKALVVKASGLAAGKGVVVAQDRAEACLAVNSMLQDKAFGAAGETIVVEELLEGEEVSVLAFTDGETVALMPPCQDYKRLKDGDRGPNTGGMGAVCPFPWLKASDLEKVKVDILQKTVEGMQKEGKKYVGVLYAGLMLTEDGPKVLEFNCRFGDPETQVLMPLLKSDLYAVCQACVEGKLAECLPEFDAEAATTAVVLVSGGYPDKYEKGQEITGLTELEKMGLLVFHAGTAVKENQLVTSGGRVLAVVATATELGKATAKALQGAAQVKFHNSAFRSDIGKRLLERLAAETLEDCGKLRNGMLPEASPPALCLSDCIGPDHLADGIPKSAQSVSESGSKSNDNPGDKSVSKEEVDCVDLLPGGVADVSVPEVPPKLAALARKVEVTCKPDWPANPEEVPLPSSPSVNGIMSDATAKSSPAEVNCLKPEVPRCESGIEDPLKPCTADAPMSDLVNGWKPDADGHLQNSVENGSKSDVSKSVEVLKPSKDAPKAISKMPKLAADVSKSAPDISKSAADSPKLSAQMKASKSDSSSLSTASARPQPPRSGGRAKTSSSPKTQTHPHPKSLSAPSPTSGRSPRSPKSPASVGSTSPSSLNSSTSSYMSTSSVCGISPASKTKASRSPGSSQLASPVGSQKPWKSPTSSPPNRITYKDAGVDISAGNSLVEAIKPMVQATKRPGCDAMLVGFGAVFDLKEAKYQDPLLVSGTDGVGTKLKIAEACGNFSTIGTDLVAMCVNDILAHGAEPLFFLDYYATGKLRVQDAAVVIQGIAQGCQLAGCALVGGETAEMPGVYHNEDFDLAGFAVGAVERSDLLPRIGAVQSGDALIGIQSSGFHSNGFSLIRRVVEMKELSYDMPSPIKTDKTLGEELLTPTRIYIKSVLPVLRGGKVKAVAHITGGGLPENLARIIPDHLCARLDARKWEMSPLFGWLAEQGHVSQEEMAQTFNCGLGAVLVVSDSHASDVVAQLQQNGEKASVVGSVKERSTGGRKVRIEQLDAALIRCWRYVPGVTRKKRVAVLISGSGTNLQALIDYTRNPANSSAAEIILVISNKPGVQGLERAQQASIQTKVINHKDYPSREAFDDALDNALTAAGIEIVCLAGFMRILTGKLVKKWEGHMLNIHPSLLPSFPGANAHKLVLEAGVRISGCTIHFVAMDVPSAAAESISGKNVQEMIQPMEKVDAGAIVTQEAVPVYPGDTEATLCERIKRVEHHAFPQALELVASERVKLRPNGSLEWL